MDKFSKRIGLTVDLNQISKHICDTYDLGNALSEQIIEIGYEDYNYILETTTGKYFIKIFYKDRSFQEVYNYIERLEKVLEMGIHFPLLIKKNQKSLYCLSIKGISYRLCVFEYLEAKDFFTLNELPTQADIKEIAKQMTFIHKIDLKPEFIYDAWSIINFVKEFEEKKQYLEKEDYQTLEKLYHRFKKLDLQTFPHAFVHGDIITTNVMKDKFQKIWIIDFAVSNYLPRIVDLAVTSCNICLEPTSKEKTYEKIKILLKQYQKYHPLEKCELENLQLFFEVANAMHILLTSYEKAMGNNSAENDYWQKEGQIGLRFSDKAFFTNLSKN